MRDVLNQAKTRIFASTTAFGLACSFLFLGVVFFLTIFQYIFYTIIGVLGTFFFTVLGVCCLVASPFILIFEWLYKRFFEK